MVRGVDGSLSLERPVLDLGVGGKKRRLPREVPDVFGDERVAEVLSQKEDIEMASLLKDVDVYLHIGDLDDAKQEYRKLLSKFNKLSNQKKKEYFSEVEKLYEEIVHFHSFWRKVRRSFRKAAKKN